MKKNKDHYYSDITSFKDIYYEKERLILKSQLIESRLTVDMLNISNAFSFSSMISTFVIEQVFPKISELLGFIVSKVETKDESYTQDVS